MIFHFCKYHGTGNDFIILDARDPGFASPGGDIISRLCNRRFGIGADGLVLLRPHEQLDFTMQYFNADGFEGTMCGNAGRCTMAFAKKTGIIHNSAKFETSDGIHEGWYTGTDSIKLSMQPVRGIKYVKDHYELFTGSPHYVMFTDSLEKKDVRSEGAAIRYSPAYKKDGINVNFVSFYKNGIFVRTYERGVEDETLSCGTGVIASAICAAINRKSDNNSYRVYTKGGNLQVSFQKSGEDRFENIFLEGPVTFVFEGKIRIDGGMEKDKR